MSKKANDYPVFKMRLDEERRAQYERAAKDGGRSLARWLKDLGDRELAAPTLPARTDKTDEE